MYAGGKSRSLTFIWDFGRNIGIMLRGSEIHGQCDSGMTGYYTILRCFSNNSCPRSIMEFNYRIIHVLIFLIIGKSRNFVKCQI